MKPKKLSKFQKFLLFCLALFAIHRIWFRAPSEAEMIAKFHQHKAEFEQIRLMLQQDKNVAAIGSDWVRAEWDEKKDRDFPLNVSEERLRLYRSRLKKLGVSTAVSLRDGRSQFSQFGGGFADTTWGIGYFYSEKTPTPLVKSAYKQRPPRDNRCYSRIESHWYIFQSR